MPPIRTTDRHEQGGSEKEEWKPPQGQRAPQLRVMLLHVLASGPQRPSHPRNNRCVCKGEGETIRPRAAPAGSPHRLCPCLPGARSVRIHRHGTLQRVAKM